MFIQSLPLVDINITPLCILRKLLYLPDAFGGYFGLSFATLPTTRREIFNVNALSAKLHLQVSLGGKHLWD